MPCTIVQYIETCVWDLPGDSNTPHYAHAGTHTHMYMYTHIHVHARAHAHAHTQTYTHTHAHIVSIQEKYLQLTKQARLWRKTAFSFYMY